MLILGCWKGEKQKTLLTNMLSGMRLIKQFLHVCLQGPAENSSNIVVSYPSEHRSNTRPIEITYKVRNFWIHPHTPATILVYHCHSCLWPLVLAAVCGVRTYFLWLHSQYMGGCKHSVVVNNYLNQPYRQVSEPTVLFSSVLEFPKPTCMEMGLHGSHLLHVFTHSHAHRYSLWG